MIEPRRHSAIAAWRVLALIACVLGGGVVRAQVPVAQQATPQDEVGQQPVAVPPVTESDESVALAVHPAHLVLGTDGSARITVRVPPNATSVDVSTNVGRVEAVTRSGPDAFTATYLPPGQTFPQFAIVAAVAQTPDGPKHGWHVLPLWGRGAARVIGTPGMQVTLRIADQTFGPATVGAQGDVRVPIVVPPGVDTAYQGKKEIPLGVPRGSLLHVALDRPFVRTAEQGDVGARIYVLDPRGAPATDASVELSVTAGHADVPAAHAPGVFAARWRLPPPGAIGSEQLTARLAGDAISAFSVRLPIVPGAPASLVLTSARPHVVASDPVVTVVAEARDAAGQRTPADIRMTTSFGEIAEQRTLEPGRVEARCVMPPRFGAHRVAVVTASVVGNGEVKAELELALKPGAPAEVVVVPSGDGVARSGASVPIAVKVRDAYGNPVPDAPPSAHAGLGALASARPTGEGEYEVQYTAPDVDWRQVETLQISAGAARVDRELELKPRAAWLRASGRAGVLTNFAAATSPVIGAEASLWPYENLGAAFELSWFSVGAQERAMDADRSVSARSQFVSATASAVGQLPLVSRFSGLASLGVGLTRVAGEVRVADEIVSAGSSVVPVAHVGLGVAMRVRRSSPFAEVRMQVQADPNLASVQGALRSVSLNLGYRFDVR